MLNGREKIQEIVQRTDLVELVRKHVELRRVGRSFVGLCPFHGERTPSFHVFPENRRYKCFGCDKGGDAISLVMELEGKDFLTAVRELASQAGVSLAFDPREQRKLEERRALLRSCETAARYFQSCLWSRAGEEARRYLRDRGVAEEVAREAGLGYAPPSWQALTDHLQGEGIDPRVAVEAGLLHPKEARFYDVFRGRLMVPIRDPDGRVIAFGGRILEGDDPRKYINSRETPLYRKGRTLYGIDVAKSAIRSSRQAILVEGYFDALALWQAGVGNAVALCSTSLTQDHVRLLQKHGTEKLVLLLDGDAAGQQAVLRVAGTVLGAGLSAAAIALPDGEDPDSFLLAKGAEAYRELERRAPPLSEFVLRSILPEERSYEGAMEALGRLRPVVAALPEGANRTLFFGEISRALEIPPRDVEAFFRGDRREEAPGPRPPAEPPRQAQGRAAPLPSRRELEMVASLFAFPGIRRELGAQVVRLLSDELLREATALLLSEMSEEEILGSLPQAIGKALAERVRLLGSRPDEDRVREVRDGLVHLEMEKLREDLRLAIGMRGELERDLFGPGGASRREDLLREIQAYGDHAAGLREKMDRLKRRLQGGPEGVARE